MKKQISGDSHESMTQEEKEAWQNMNRFQKDKTILNRYIQRDIVAQTYLKSFMLRKGICCEEQILLSDEIKEYIYELYLAGVLPMRLGGVNL